MSQTRFFCAVLTARALHGRSAFVWFADILDGLPIWSIFQIQRDHISPTRKRVAPRGRLLTHAGLKRRAVDAAEGKRWRCQAFEKRNWKSPESVAGPARFS